jgi:protein-tyrosine phosphatase
MTIEHLRDLDQVRIIMVCMGNICRSPAAEVVLRQKLSAANINDVHVDSAGTGGWHEGDGADPRSQAAWERRGYRGRHTARQFQKHWFDERDLILVMDADNYSTMLNWTNEPEHVAKLHFLRAFDPSLTDASDVHAVEVPDPYYGGAQGFEHMLDLIERACDGLVQELRALR